MTHKLHPRGRPTVATCRSRFYVKLDSQKTCSSRPSPLFKLLTSVAQSSRWKFNLTVSTSVSVYKTVFWNQRQFFCVMIGRNWENNYELKFQTLYPFFLNLIVIVIGLYLGSDSYWHCSKFLFYAFPAINLACLVHACPCRGVVAWLLWVSSVDAGVGFGGFKTVFL